MTQAPVSYSRRTFLFFAAAASSTLVIRPETSSAAESATRILALHSRWSEENFIGPFYEQGKYLPDALGEINHLLRDRHARALAAGVRFHGCTVHFVRFETDTGPIIAQAAVPVQADDTPDSLAARVLAQEHRIYPQALAWVAEGRVRIEGDRAVVTGAAVPPAVLISPIPI